MEISCEENINKSNSSNVKEVEEKNMQVITDQKQKPKKNLLFKLIIIISILIIISIIIELMILFIRKKKKKITLILMTNLQIQYQIILLTSKIY